MDFQRRLRQILVFRILCGLLIVTFAFLAVGIVQAATIYDLTVAGSTVTINGAIFEAFTPNDPAGSGLFNSFVRISSSNPVIQGYNTDYRPLQFDEDSSSTLTLARLLSEVPQFVVNEILYREFQLDINQNNTVNDSLLSLDDLEIYESPYNDLCGYPFDGSGGGHTGCISNNTATLIFDMDALEDSFVVLDYKNNDGAGKRDLKVLVPDSFFNQDPACDYNGTGCNVYTTIYSQLGGDSVCLRTDMMTTCPNTDGYEEWGVRVEGGIELLTNTSFETYIPVGWQDGRQIEPYDGPDCGAGNARTGNCAVHFEGDGTNKRVFMRYRLHGAAGDSFELNIYRRGLSVPTADGAFVKATFFYKDGTQEVFKVNLDTGTIGTWEQFTVPFEAAKPYKRVNLDLFYKKASGTMWLDDISLTRNGGAELLENTSFEIYKPDDYIRSVNIDANEGPDCSGSNMHSGTCSVYFDGDSTNKRLLTRVRHTGSPGDSIAISIWRKGVSVPAASGAYVKVEVFYTDGTSDIFKMYLDVGNLELWEQIRTNFTAAKDYKRFNVDLFYKKASGTIWLDDISLLTP